MSSEQAFIAQHRSLRRLEGQVAVVTGAGTGIGLATEGAKVALSGRRREPLEEAATVIRGFGGEALVIPANVAQPEEVDKVFDEVERQWGKLDILFANA